MTYTNQMVYDDAKSIGIDYDSLKQLMNILTPRMQKQLLVSLKEEKFLNDVHNNLADELNNTIPPAVEPEQFLNDHIQIIEG